MTHPAKSNTKLAALLLALALCMAGMVAILFYFYLLPGQLDPQGDASTTCVKKELPAIANGDGMVVTTHHTVCDGEAIHFSGSTYYVYLHKQGIAGRPDDLIFRYADIQKYSGTASPKIEWNGKTSLSISVDEPQHISRLISLRDGIKINYTLGLENNRLVKGNQESWAIEEIVALLVILMILLMTSSYKIIRLIVVFRKTNKLLIAK